MNLHFTEVELAGRRQKATEALEAEGLDGLLILRQESMYYLTGYDTMGYSQFQCLYMGADGDLVLLTRSPDLRQSKFTSVIEDVRIWVDSGDANPGLDLRSVLEEKGCRGKRLGVELEAWTLTGRRWDMVRAALDDFCRLEDASHLVSELRLVKSDAEVAYVRKAAELADAALEEAHRLIEPGTPELELFAGMHGVVFRGGGDYPAGRWIIGSGERALMVRNFTGHGDIGDNDQVQMEFGVAYRHYHSCLMRTVLTGRPDPQHVRMHAAGVEALRAAQGGLQARGHLRRRVRRPRKGLRRRRLSGAPPERLRLQFGRTLPADVDGLPHAFHRQPRSHRAQQDHLHAHDPSGQRPRPRDVSRGNSPRHRHWL